MDFNVVFSVNRQSFLHHIFTLYQMCMYIYTHTTVNRLMFIFLYTSTQVKSCFFNVIQNIYQYIGKKSHLYTCNSLNACLIGQLQKPRSSSQLHQPIYEISAEVFETAFQLGQILVQDSLSVQLLELDGFTLGTPVSPPSMK